MKRKSVAEASTGKKRGALPYGKKPGSSAASRQPDVRAEPRDTEPTGRSNGQSSVSAEERKAMIARLAYLRAEQRGFHGGTSLEDWLQAEAEVDAQLARSASGTA